MEITIKTTDLVKELSLGQGVVEKKTTIPVLSNVLLEAVGDSLKLTATDLELGIESSCAATVVKPGSTTLPAKKLLDYVRLLPDAEVALKVGENHSVSIVCGRSRTKVAGLSRENFPELPEMPAAITSIPTKTLVRSISRTMFAVANEESRYTLIGALLLLQEDALTLVATDGHRLSFIRTPGTFEGVSGEVRGLVPKKALGELLKLDSEGGDSMAIEFSTDENHMFFRCAGRLLITRKLTGQFPDYDRVLPADPGEGVNLNKIELTSALRRVSQFADDRSRAVRFELREGELKMAASGSEAGESEETVPIDYSGSNVTVGFNSQYVLEFLNVADTDEVSIQFGNDESAGQLQLVGDEGCDYRYVVMPMRI